MAILKSFDFKNTGEIITPQELIHAQDLYGMIGFARGFGIVSGCGLSRATNQITIASGTLRVAGSELAFGGDNETVTDSGMSSGQHRWTNIYITPAGATGMTNGTAVSTSAFPVKPTDTTNYVICSALKLYGSDLTDDRVMPSSLDYTNMILPVENLENTSSAYMLMGNVSGVPTWTTITGDVLISNTGVTSVQTLSGLTIADDTTLGMDGAGNYGFKHRSASSDMVIGSIFGAGMVISDAGTLTINRAYVNWASNSSSLDINPSGTGSYDVVDITPSAALVAGSNWKANNITMNALNPATGTPSNIFGSFYEMRYVTSALGNAEIVGMRTYGNVSENTTGHSHIPQALTGTNSQYVARSTSFTLDLTTTSTSVGFELDWDSITRSAGAPVLKGVNILLPADYTGFGTSYAAKFSGDGNTTTLCGTYPLQVAEGTSLSSSESIIAQFQGNSSQIPILRIMAKDISGGVTPATAIVNRNSGGSYVEVMEFINQTTSIKGTLGLDTVINAGTDTDKFLVLDSSNNVDFRTGAEVASDIGATPPSPHMGWLLTGALELLGKTYNTTTQTVAGRGIFIRADGLKMFVCSDNSSSGQDIYRYSLSTAWDVTTATYDSNTVNIYSDTNVGTTCIWFSDDGLKMYIGNGYTDAMYEFTLSIAWDLSSTVTLNDTFAMSPMQNLADFYFSPDGKRVIGLRGNGGILYSYTMSSAWDLTTISYDSISISINGISNYNGGVTLSPDGQRMICTDASSPNADIYEYYLTTPWDISTATNVPATTLILSFSGGGTRDCACFTNADGTLLYVIYSNEVVRMFRLGHTVGY